MELSQNLKTSLLLETYGNLLTDKQRSIMKDFCDNNMSLSEIAESNNSSRQAVNDLIRRSTASLNEYERRLGLLARFIDAKSKIDDVIEYVKNNGNNKELITKLLSILEDM